MAKSISRVDLYDTIRVNRNRPIQLTTGEIESVIPEFNDAYPLPDYLRKPAEYYTPTFNGFERALVAVLLYFGFENPALDGGIVTCQDAVGGTYAYQL